MGNLGYGAYPTHQGEVLKDEIEARGISQRKLAESMGLTYSVVNEILNGHRPLTARTALMFEAALDVPADSLMYRMSFFGGGTDFNGFFNEYLKGNQEDCCNFLILRIQHFVEPSFLSC